jgi:hypothetical protein
MVGPSLVPLIGDIICRRRIEGRRFVARHSGMVLVLRVPSTLHATMRLLGRLERLPIGFSTLL